MTGKASAAAGAVWQSQHDGATAREAATAPAAARPQRRARPRPAPCRTSSRRSSAKLGRAAARRRRLGARDQVRRLSPAAARRGRRGDAAAPARGSTGPRSSRPSPRPAATLPDCMIDGEVVALDDDGAPDFAALQAALSDGETDDLIFFAFDLLFADGEDLRAAAAARAQGAAEGAARRGARRKHAAHPLRRAFRDGGRRGAAIGLPHVSWKASSPSSSTRPTAPAAATAGPRPSAAPATRW